MRSKEKPYILFVAELIYLEVSKIKKNNPLFSNVEAIENFIGSPIYNEISSGEYHEKWFQRLKIDDFIDQKTKKKIPDDTIRLLNIQKDMMTKQLVQFPNLYYAKSHFPLEVSQRAFDSIWRMCESYELWCLETKQPELLNLKIID